MAGSLTWIQEHALSGIFCGVNAGATYAYDVYYIHRARHLEISSI